MKTKIALSITCLICIVFMCSAQKINSEKVFAGYKFTQNGKGVNINQLAKIVSDDLEAKKLMRSAKSNVQMGTILAGVGGFLIGWPVGSAIGGGEPNWLLAAGGVLAAGIGLPLSNSGYKRAREAVRIYNNSLEKPTGSNKFKPQFEIATTQNGIGLLMRF